jgi:pimeloyl-ACP methyl ester carboxylesterase
MRFRSFVFFMMLVAVVLAIGPVSANARTQSTGNHPPSVDDRQNLQGNWHGKLNATFGGLRLVLKISKAADGTFKATMDSPDQGAVDLAVDEFTFKDSYVRFEMNDIHASFNGGLSRDGSEIAGQFSQGPTSPLVLRREGNATPTASPGFTRGRVKLVPCNIPALTKDAGCGKYEVFEDRAAKSGRKIALNIAVLPALSAKPAPDPVFMLAGGPGQGAVAVIKIAGDYLIRLRRDRDIVFVDQRGTGESNPLSCNLVGNKDEMRGYFTEGMSVENLGECRAQLEKTANLALYTSPIAMDDLDEVRAALGYDKINLHGGSYGTVAGLVYIRQHPDRVRTAMLEGVSTVDAKIYLPFAKGVEHALERLFTDCAAAAECNAAFPNLRAEFKELTAKLDKQPVAFESTNLFTGKREQVTLARDMFADSIRTVLYIPLNARWLPLLIHEANKNNWGPLASISYANARGIADQIARGMHLSVVCSEDIPSITEEEIKRNTAGTFYGDYRVRTMIKACEQWPKGKVAAGFNDPVKSDIPILMITGDLDPVAPPWLAAEAARLLPNSRQISISNTGHYFRFECIDDLLAEFVTKGSAKGLNDSCVKEIQRPPFLTKLPPQLAK